MMVDGTHLEIADEAIPRWAAAIVAIDDLMDCLASMLLMIMIMIILC